MKTIPVEKFPSYFPPKLAARMCRGGLLTRRLRPAVTLGVSEGPAAQSFRRPPPTDSRFFHSSFFIMVFFLHQCDPSPFYLRPSLLTAGLFSSAVEQGHPAESPVNSPWPGFPNNSPDKISIKDPLHAASEARRVSDHLLAAE